MMNFLLLGSDDEEIVDDLVNSKDPNPEENFSESFDSDCNNVGPDVGAMMVTVMILEVKIRYHCSVC